MCEHFVSTINSLISVKIEIVPFVHNWKPRHVYRKMTHGVKEPDSLPKPLEFEDSFVSNHKIVNKSTPDRKYARCAQIMKNATTEWFHAYPSPRCSTDTVVENVLRFHPPKVLPEHVYTGDAKEFRGAAKRLDIPSDVGTPHHSASKATVERCVQAVNEGTSAALVQSGLDEMWWPDAMICFGFLEQVCDKLQSGRTAYFQRF